MIAAGLAVWAAIENQPGYVVALIGIVAFAGSCLAINEALRLWAWAYERWSSDRRFRRESVALIDYARKEMRELAALPRENYDHHEATEREQAWLARARDCLLKHDLSYRWYEIEDPQVDPNTEVPPEMEEMSAHHILLLFRWRARKEKLLVVVHEALGRVE